MITSRDNEKLRLVRKLHDRRWRDKLGLFFVEGEDAIAAAAGVAEPVELLVAGESVAAALLAEVSTAAHPPRAVAVFRHDDLPEPATRPVTLALWRVADPGNIGTLVRTADCFGAAVALSDGCADPTGPKALRAAAGSIWRVPILYHANVLTRERDPEASAETGAGSRPGEPGRRPQRIALQAHGGTPLAEANIRGDTVFLLGAERGGLPAEADRDIDVTIPIEGAESLNVAAAGAIALYEWHRRSR